MSGDRVPPDTPAPAGSEAARRATEGFLYLVPVAVGAALPLLRMPIVTHYVPVDDYGAWALATVYAAFATSVASLGLPVAYERNSFEQATPRDRSGLLYSVTAFVAAACVLIGIITFGWRDELSQALTGRPHDGRLLFWTYCATAITTVKAYFLLYLRNAGDARSYVRYTVDDTVGGTVLSVLLIVFAGSGVMGLPLGSVIAGVVVTGLMIRRARRELAPRLDGRQLGAALKIGLPLVPRLFLRVVTANLDKYVVGALASVGGVGIYAVGQRIGYSVFTLMTAMENMFNPAMYKRMFAGGPDASRDVGRLLTPFVYLSVGAAILMAAASPEVVTLLTASEYGGAIPVAVIFSAYYATLFFGKIPQLTFAKKTGLISVLAAAGTALNVAFALLLVPRWGAVGAALATLIGGALAEALSFAVSQRAWRIDWEYPRLLAMFGLLGLTTGVTLWAAQGATPSAGGVLLRLAALGMYAALGVHIGLLTRDNLGAVGGLLRAQGRARISARRP